MVPKAVKDYVDSHRQRFLEELLELLRFASISAGEDRLSECQACAEHLAGAFRKLGFLAELRPCGKSPNVLARSGPGMAPAEAPTVLVYGHYDVQPVEPLSAWKSPPFQPAVRDGFIYARGASDDKGQLLCHVKAAEAYLRTQGRLPANLVFLLEGQEEIGSGGMEKFLSQHAGELVADYAVLSDTAFFAAGVPSIIYGLRGLACVELTLSGPRQDLHSGVHGGGVVNPLNAVARMVAAMHDERGRITLPGFYDEVVETTDQERRLWQRLPLTAGQYAAEVGAEPVGGEAGRDLWERRWARPTLDCNGIVGGHAGAGSKTVIPAQAVAKISMRLVPRQGPEKIVESFRAFVAGHTPAGVRASVATFGLARPVLIPMDTPAISAARAALKEAFAADALPIRDGASVPITELIQRVLKLDPILLGLGLPDDNLHAPNERFSLDQFHRGIHAAAAVLLNLGALGRR